MLQGIEQTDTNGSIGLTIIEFFLIPFIHILIFLRFLGDHSEGETPVPIPNTEVKPFNADGTAWVTVWESRTLPRLKIEGPSEMMGLFI